MSKPEAIRKGGENGREMRVVKEGSGHHFGPDHAAA
jgi:hypothetical protein